jgi:hypothetical protein
MTPLISGYDLIIDSERQVPMLFFFFFGNYVAGQKQETKVKDTQGFGGES